MKDLILPGQGPLPPQPQMSMVTAQLGMSPAMIGCSAMCVNCFPKAMPAFFIWQGFSLCAQCFIPLRKQFDWTGEVEGLSKGFPPLSKRDPKETWGEEPVK